MMPTQVGLQLGSNTEHALTGGGLAWAHRDRSTAWSFAQCLVDGLTLITTDRAMQTAPGISLLPW